jgi:rieske iron-sulfur protein
VCSTPVHERRSVLKVAFGTGLGLLLRHGAMAQDADPHNARPQEGDHFVFTGGERKGTIITPEDLPVGGPPVTAYPMDPSTRVVRDGSRLNQVLLIRLEAPELTEATRAHAMQGLVGVLGDLYAYGMRHVDVARGDEDAQVPVS